MEVIFYVSLVVAAILTVCYLGFYIVKRKKINVRIVLTFVMAIIGISWIFSDNYVLKTMQPARNVIYFIVWLFYFIVEWVDSRRNDEDDEDGENLKN